SLGDHGASVILVAPPRAVVELETSNGYIVCERMHGGIQAHTSNAKVDVVASSGPIEIESSNGPLLIEAEQAQVQADTSNAGIRFRGSLIDAEHRFETSNGPLELELPADSQFRFEAATSNGGIDVAFPLDKEDRRRRKRSGVVGQNPRCTLE